MEEYSYLAAYLALAISIYNFIKSAKIKGGKITDVKGKEYYEKL